MIIVLLAGNLGGDPDVRFSASGIKITSFSVASNSKRQGKEETTWYKVIIFGDHLDKMISYLKKGSSVIVNGSLNLNKWTDKEGREQTTAEVTADSLRFSPFGRPAEPGQSQAAPGQRAPAAANSYAQPSYAQPQAAQPAYGGAPAYTTPQQPQAQPFEVHDFSFGSAPADSSHGGYEDTPF
ncbi:MAG: single-stranded DNA-binding protein [Parachlamydiaceae bacterium]|nr:single-stranded DNA-binding protein [Parachlamydiaceae bacterium]